MSEWLSACEVYGEKIHDWIQLSKYRFGFVTHVPADGEWMGRLRSVGSKPIPYVTLYQQPMYSTYQGIDLRRHTDWIEIDEGGNWKRTSFWESEDQKNWYVVCPNVEGYVEAILDYVGGLMEAGAGGVFVDNVGLRNRCFGPDFGTHGHIHRDQQAAFADLLRRVREVIKAHDPEGLLLLNSASPDTLPDEYWLHADADMAESYICTWVSDTRWMDWHDYWNAMGKKVEGWLQRGKAVLALSYLGHTKNSLKDDAFFCYSSARLSGFLWSAGGDVLRGDPAEVLYTIRLGRAKGAEEEELGVHYREFDYGLVAVNPEKRAGELRIPGRARHIVFDVYEGCKIAGVGDDVKVRLPAESGRVYLYLPEHEPRDTEPNVLEISTSPALGNVKFLIDGVETFTHSGRWTTSYVKGPSFGTLLSKYAEPGEHVVEAADVSAGGLAISKGYGSVEKLGKLMDPAEPTRPAGRFDYRFKGWRLGSKVLSSRRIEVQVEGKTKLTAIYESHHQGSKRGESKAT